MYWSIATAILDSPNSNLSLRYLLRMLRVSIFCHKCGIYSLLDLGFVCLCVVCCCISLCVLWYVVYSVELVLRIFWHSKSLFFGRCCSIIVCAMNSDLMAFYSKCTDCWIVPAIIIHCHTLKNSLFFIDFVFCSFMLRLFVALKQGWDWNWDS